MEVRIGWEKLWDADVLCSVSVAGRIFVWRTYVVHQASFVKGGLFLEIGDLAIGLRQLILQLGNRGRTEGSHDENC
jgi:hypothetical protein